MLGVVLCVSGVCVGLFGWLSWITRSSWVFWMMAVFTLVALVSAVMAGFFLYEHLFHPPTHEERALKELEAEQGMHENAVEELRVREARLQKAKEAVKL